MGVSIASIAKSAAKVISEGLEAIWEGAVMLDV